MNASQTTTTTTERPNNDGTITIETVTRTTNSDGSITEEIVTSTVPGNAPVVAPAVPVASGNVEPSDPKVASATATQPQPNATAAPTQVQPTPSDAQGCTSKQKMIWGIVAALVLIVGLAVGLGVGLSGGGDDEPAPAPAPSPANSLCSPIEGSTSELCFETDSFTAGTDCSLYIKDESGSEVYCRDCNNCGQGFFEYDCTNLVSGLETFCEDYSLPPSPTPAPNWSCYSYRYEY